MTINLYPERRGTTSSRKVMVYLREKQASFQYNPNIKVDIEKWDKHKQRVKKGHKNSMHINYALQNLIIKIEGIYAKYKSEYPLGSFAEFKPYFKEVIQRPNIDIENIEEKDYQPSHLLIVAYQEYLEAKKNVWNKSTAMIRKCYKNYLDEFQIHWGRELYLSDINYDFYEKLIDFSVTIKKHSNYTIKNKIKVIHSLQAWAKKKGYINEIFKNPIVIKAKTSRAIALSKEELSILYNHKFENIIHSQIRDVFCFACYTAGRYSDVKTIRREHLTDKNWKYRSPKTGKYIVVPLQKEALAILEKYKENLTPLPVPNLDQINKYLKVICKEVNIDTPTVKESAIGGKITEKIVPKYEMITFHTGRRTFATLAINAGKPPSIVMKITGHSDISTLMTYVKTTSEQVEEEFNGAWF